MRSLLPLAVLLSVMIAGCSKSDPYAKYRDVQLKRGMKIADIKQQFGELDSFDDFWFEPGVPLDYRSSEQSPEHTKHYQDLNYGAFGAHDQKKGHITKHRLSMTFVDGELRNWNKSTPVGSE